MKTLKDPIIIYIVTCCALILFGTSAAVSVPKEAVQSTIDSILETLKDKNLSLPARKQERRDKIRALISDRFDFNEMARRSLARHWRKRTPEEQKEFVSIFSDLLVSSYVGKIERYTDEKIRYDKEIIKSGGKYAVVKTTIVTKSVDIPIDYKVRLKGSKWWVYDIVIEGVSFISTYRSQYNKIIVKESYTGLIKKMKSKLDELNSAL